MTKTLIIDGQEVEVDPDLTLMQVCEDAGAEIPRFCYHERLSIAGNCRMCLVEVVGSPKPVASCAMTVRDLPPNRDGSPKVIRTNTPLVKKAREGVMEFLLINHPLDCPICDQGGECDLQDQAMAFGIGGSRYHENKRAVEEKYIGPLIKTMMTRCIHCTRCVRYMTEVAGVDELGLVGRGEDAEITTYLEKGILSEMSANAVDLCPVGALTHRPWAFHARPWELKSTESIDVMDAVGSAIRVDARGSEVMRILPRNNDAVNEEWISDKTRHVCDGLRTQRLDQPYIRRDGMLQPASWDDALRVVAEKLKSADKSRVAALAGDLAGVEEMFALRDLMRAFGVKSIDCREPESALDPSLGRSSYLFNASIEGIEDADVILLVGTNPRWEAAVLNSRILKRSRRGRVRIGLVGEACLPGYPVEQVGSGPTALQNVLEGKHDFADALEEAKAPMIIVGPGGYVRKDGKAVLAMVAQIAQKIAADGASQRRVVNILHKDAARVGGLDIGFVPVEGGFATADILERSQSGGLDVLYLLGADDVANTDLGSAFVVYQGSHGDVGAQRADVILPGAAYTEKSATYVNTEGRAQMTVQAVFPPGLAKEDWTIIRALSAVCGHTLSYDTVAQLRALMYREVPQLAAIDSLTDANDDGINELATRQGALDERAFEGVIKDYYLTNPIARASAIMAELSGLAAMEKKRDLVNAAE